MNDNQNEVRIAKPKPRSKKLNPRIDFAAMVSVSFLLIIFFMLTSYLSRPQAMDLGVPSCGDGAIHCGPIGCNNSERQITLLLDGNNKIISYRGLLEFPEQMPQTLDYGKNGIRKQLAEAVKRIPEITGDKDKGAIVIIKPSKKSNYGNLVDILDEVAIAQVQTYAIINDFTPEEYKLLASK